jgi:hypothetical protein
MKQNEIKVVVNSEEMNLAKVEKTLKSLARIHEKAIRNKKAYINDTDWNEYNAMEDGDKNDLLTRCVISKGFSSVQKIKNHKADSADYMYINNIGYVMSNISHIVADTFVRIESQYKAKYPHNVHRAVRCAIANSIYHCKKDDYSNATALYKDMEDGKEVCIIDTENESCKPYEINVETYSILLAEIDTLTERERFIIQSIVDGYTREETAKRLYYHGIDKEKVTSQAISKTLKKIQEKLR